MKNYLYFDRAIWTGPIFDTLQYAFRQYAASAASLNVQLCLATELTPFRAFRSGLPGYHTFLSPPSTCLIYPMRFRVVIGLRLVKQSYPRMRPYMRFLYVRPEVCPRVSKFPESSFLQIPPHGGHPCFRLCPSHYRADSGLTPVRNVRRLAH